MERGLLVELSRNEESALRRISVGIDQSEMRPRDVGRLKLLAPVEMRGSAVVLTPIGVRQVAKLPDRWEADEPEWPTLTRLAGGGGRKERSMPWTYYDAAGKPVPEKAATFRCREVSVDGSAPAPPCHGSLGAIEYHDVHAIDQPELRKTFKSFSKMKAWFKEHASKTKGQAR